MFHPEQAITQGVHDAGRDVLPEVRLQRAGAGRRGRSTVKELKATLPGGRDLLQLRSEGGRRDDVMGMGMRIWSDSSPLRSSRSLTYACVATGVIKFEGTITRWRSALRSELFGALRSPHRLNRRRRVFPAPLTEQNKFRHVDPAAADFDAGDPPLGLFDLRRQLALGEPGSLPHLLQKLGDFTIDHRVVGFRGHGHYY